MLLGAFGITHPDFPGSAVASRVVMLASAVLVAATLTTAVTTACEAVLTAGAAAAPTGSAAPTSALNLSADPTGKLAYDKKQATVRAGRFALRLVNNSSLPHNVTIVKGRKGPRPDKDNLRRVGNHHRESRARRIRLLLRCRRAPRAGMQGTLTVK